MRVTVLGSAASYASSGQACSGHLVQHGDTAVLLDCGNGVVANLAAVIDPLRLSAVFVSHAHPDHFLDLYALQALLRYAPEGPSPPLELYAPEGLRERMSTILSEQGGRDLEAAFKVHTLMDGVCVRVGSLSVEPCRVNHGESAFALRVFDGKTLLCYTGDTAFDHRVRDAAAGCDLLLAEATLPAAYQGAAAHMTAAEAGKLAREAGAATLVLVHVWPTNDRAEMLRDASRVCGARVFVAREFDVYPCEPPNERGE